ncbi:MAG: calcium-binding protein, partial [Gammaproteobacteria bacterium]
NDSINAGAGDDVIEGGAGNDSLNAGAGNNVVDGGDGDDRLYGHTGGSDELRGGAGNDYIYADGNDTVDGGEGTDRVYTYGEDDVSLNMGEASVESVYAQSNADHNIDDSTSDAGVTVSLRAGDDVVTGSDHNDNINTGDGDDVIEGGDGNDRINAGAGDDVIEGGDGNDSINGGDGNDIFLFEGNSGSDSVNGGSGEGWLDTIDLSNSVGGETEVSSPWQIEINGEEVDFDIDAGSLELGVDVSGIIQFDDGSQISFDNIETIEW